MLKWTICSVSFQAKSVFSKNVKFSAYLWPLFLPQEECRWIFDFTNIKIQVKTHLFWGLILCQVLCPVPCLDYLTWSQINLMRLLWLLSSFNRCRNWGTEWRGTSKVVTQLVNGSVRDEPQWQSLLSVVSLLPAIAFSPLEMVIS